MLFDWLIVGAGFTGATLAERLASQLNQTVLIIDQRNHIGGNAYDYVNQHGILVHKYGPHVFRTNSEKIWRYLSRFTTWRPYEHRVLAVLDEKEIPVPFNLNSLHALFLGNEAKRLENLLLNRYGKGTKVPVLKLVEDADPKLKKLGKFIYDKIYYGYTVKQWDLRPEDLDASVTGRVPVSISWDDRYFQDKYQAMPKFGYTHLFQEMLSHPNITVLTNTSYRSISETAKFNRIIYTGAVDVFMDFVHGELPYRSLHFREVTLEQDWWQRVGTVNYPNDHRFTRITELKHLTGQSSSKTTLMFEFPQPHIREKNEPYYPIPRPDNRDRYNRYLRDVNRLNGTVFFAGRLGDYRCYSMDQAVGRALTMFESEIARVSSRNRCPEAILV
jgi:UDP-galactopyranose mutase